MKKKLTAVVLCTVMVLASINMVSAGAGTQVTQLQFVIDSPFYTRNGARHETIDRVPPYIDTVFNRTMVPLATVGQALGANVSWNESNRTVVITRGNTVISLPVDAQLPADRTTGASMGRPAIVNNRTFVPIAYVSQMLGASVSWDGANRAVHIVDSGGSQDWTVSPTPTSSATPIPSMPTMPTMPPITIVVPPIHIVTPAPPTPTPTPTPTATPLPSQHFTTPRPAHTIQPIGTATPLPTATPSPDQIEIR